MVSTKRQVYTGYAACFTFADGRYDLAGGCTTWMTRLSQLTEHSTASLRPMRRDLKPTAHCVFKHPPQQYPLPLHHGEGAHCHTSTVERQLLL